MSSQAPDPPPRRQGARTTAHEIERLSSRLAEVDESLQRERARRTASDQALEQLRAESRGLRGEVGRLRAQLGIANAAQLQAASAAAELDAAREESFAARQALAQEQDESERLRARLTELDGTGRQQPAPAPQAGRRVNRSRRRRTDWLGRALALLFMLAVIAALALVIHSSV
jgi:chromosome segregation ATPase